MLAKLSVLLFLALSAAASDTVDASDTDETCKPYFDKYCDRDKPGPPTGLKPCSPIYGAVSNNKDRLRKYVKEHIGNSFEYLLQWANFNNYKKDRAGFAKLYRKLSDDAWEDSIKLIKYMGKRGVELDFANLVEQEVHETYNQYGVSPVGTASDTEIASLAKVLDLHKHLAISGNSLHESSLKRDAHGKVPNMEHDMELAHFIEEEFAGKHAQTVRDLAGHSDDLHRLLKEGNKETKDNKDLDARGLYVHLFDEYLNKLY